MSRNHSMAMRGTSNDSRVKTKTKKMKNCQERKPDQPQTKSSQGIEQRNIDILLHIAYNLSEMGHKYPQHRLKLCDVRTLDALTKQLKAMKEAENYERFSNRIKAKEMRDYADIMRERKQHQISEAQRGYIMKSRSPKNIFFAQQVGSPKPKRRDYGLIERKIEQDQNKATFANIRKKEQIFGRLLDNIDKIAQKLSVDTSNREQGFKGYISKISSSITAITNRQLQQTTIINENKQLKEIITKLEGQLKENIQKSSKIEYQLRLSFEQTIKEQRNKLKDLQQEFSMLTLEKLSVQKQLSTSKKMIENMRYKSQQRLKQLKYQVQQQLNEQMEQMKNTRNRLSIEIKQLVCFSKQITNKIISQYTKLLHSAFLEQQRLRKQNSTLFHQKNEIFQNSKLQHQKMRGHFKQEYRLKQARKKQNNRIQGVFMYSFKQTKPQTDRNLNIFKQAQIVYEPSKKEDKSFQVIFQQKIFSNIHNIVYEADKRRDLCLCSQNISVKLLFAKNSEEVDTQTIQQIKQKQVSDNQSQTAQKYFENEQVQTDIQQHKLHGKELKRLDFVSNIINQTENFKKQFTNNFVQTNRKNLCFSGLIQQIIYTSYPTPLLKIDADTNTQHSVLHMLSPVRNIPEEYIDFASSNKKSDYKSQNPIIDLLLQAQQCILVPQISVLKEQILHYQQEIVSLNTMIQTLKEKQQKQQQNVFQFCF